jgi:uncharacterized phage protein (TIGR01671 family)
MREIEFRALDRTVGDWNFFVIDGLRALSNEELEASIGIGSPIWHAAIKDGRIDLSTLTGSIGLKDKNGKEIYEGDVVHLGGDGSIHDDTGNWWGASGSGGFHRPEQEIKWSNEYCGFMPFCIYDSDCGVQMDAKKTNVIGNIYENPELISGV